MTDPTRLLEDSQLEADERRVLLAGQRMEPTQAQQHATWDVLMVQISGAALGAATATTASSAHAAMSASTAASSASGAAATGGATTAITSDAAIASGTGAASTVGDAAIASGAGATLSGGTGAALASQGAGALAVAIAKWTAVGAVVGSSAVFAGYQLRDPEPVPAPTTDMADTPTETPPASSLEAAQPSPTASQATLVDGDTAEDAELPTSADGPTNAERSEANRPPSRTVEPIAPQQRPSAESTAPRTGHVDDSLPRPALDPYDEARRVARARAALRSGAPRQAQALLEQLALDHPQGSLVQEREALAIEAQFALGQKALARQRATRFLEQAPESPYAARVRALLD